MAVSHTRQYLPFLFRFLSYFALLMYSTFLYEPQLIAFGYDLEQELNVRMQPQFLHSAIPVPNAGLCGQPSKPQVFTGSAHLPHKPIF